MLTKSNFIVGMKCPHRMSEMISCPERFGSGTDRLAEEGRAVGMLAGNLFQKVRRIPPAKDISDRVKLTEKAIKNGDPVIAEAAFEAGELYCQTDYLRIWAQEAEINEVKATTSIRKKPTKGKKKEEMGLDEQYLWDLGFQYHVLTQSGLKVNRINCIHLNPDYRRKGELDLNSLFVIEDCTEEVKEYCENSKNPISEDIEWLENYLNHGNDHFELGTKCRKNGDICEMWDECSRELPKPNVFDLNGSFNRKRDAFYRSGLISYPDLFNSEELNQKGRIQVGAELTGEPHIDPEGIKEFLEKIRYPLYFLDFETYQNAIPVFDEQWPYEQVPFQYSLDTIPFPGAEIIHEDLLAREGEDPRREIAESLVSVIPKNACVTAYNYSFERDRLRELADLFPDLAEHLRSIADNLVDFIVPFNNYWLYRREMQGKSSIKYVLPALFPDDESLNYHNLPGVQRGDQAMEMFLQLPDLDDMERRRQRAYMLRYCRLDTFAMIKVYEALLRAADDGRYEGVMKATTLYAEQMKRKDDIEDAELADDLMSHPDNTSNKWTGEGTI